MKRFIYILAMIWATFLTIGVIGGAIVILSKL
jgi:hypothetical protein